MRILHQTKREEKQRKPALKLGTWNLQSMMACLTEKHIDIADARKTDFTNDELSRLNVDIAIFQETHLAEWAH